MSLDQNASSTSNETVVAAAKAAPPKPKRKTKRFLWQDELHRRFVAAIFELGLKNASPKALLPLMKASSPESELTTEHLKSHLQKYRINHQSAQQEFQDMYERQTKRSRKRQRRLNHRSMSSPALVFPVRGKKRHKGHNSTDSDSSSDPEFVENTPSAAKSDLQRHRSFAYGLSVDTTATSAYGYPVGYLPTPPNGAMADVIDPQWNTFNMLMSTPLPQTALSIQVPNETPSVTQLQAQEELQLQMYQAMQAQMNFHRQMLTRKVEVSHQVFPTGRPEALNNGNTYPGYAEYPRDTIPGNVGQMWTATQNVHQHQLEAHRLQQQINNFDGLKAPPQQVQPAKAPAKPVASVAGSLPTLITTLEMESAESVDDEVSGDLERWDRFNLNVDLDSDDLFDFLKE